MLDQTTSPDYLKKIEDAKEAEEKATIEKAEKEKAADEKAVAKTTK